MKHLCKKFLQHLRELFSSNNSQIFVPSRKLRRVDTDAYNRKYAGRRATHNRHEQNK